MHIIEVREPLRLPTPSRTLSSLEIREHPASPLLPCPAIPHCRRLLPSPPRIASSSPSLRSAAASSSPHLALPPPPPPPHPASPPPPPCLHSRRSPISASPPRLHSRRSPHAPAPPPSLPSLLDLGRSRHAVTRKAQAIATAVFERRFASAATRNSYDEILTSLVKPGGGTEFGKYYSLPALSDPRIDRLPYSIRIHLESAIRNCDEFQVTGKDVEKIIDWENSAPKQVEIPFKPARVLQELSDKAYSMGAASGLIRCRYSV